MQIIRILEQNIKTLQHVRPNNCHFFRAFFYRCLLLIFLWTHWTWMSPKEWLYIFPWQFPFNNSSYVHCCLQLAIIVKCQFLRFYHSSTVIELLIFSNMSLWNTQRIMRDKNHDSYDDFYISIRFEQMQKSCFTLKFHEISHKWWNSANMSNSASLMKRKLKLKIQTFLVCTN